MNYNELNEKIKCSIKYPIKSLELLKDFVKKHIHFKHELIDHNIKINTNKAPKPYITSTFIQDVNNLYHIPPKMTMKYAQQLYEDGYITYMRTDRAQLSIDCVKQVNRYIIDKYGKEMCKNDIDYKKNKNAQEAHEAIRPTNVNTDKNKIKSDIHRKIYELIWKRTIASCMKDSKSKQLNIIISSPEENNPYQYKHDYIYDMGWNIIYKNEKSETTKKNLMNKILKIVESDIFKIKRLELESKIIKKEPHYYNYASWIQTLEKKGIGRPSTFSNIVEKVIEREYVRVRSKESELKLLPYICMKENNDIQENEREVKIGGYKNKIIITPLGIIVSEFLFDTYNSIFNYDFTSTLENDLDLVMTENISWIKICNQYGDIIKKYKSMHIFSYLCEVNENLNIKYTTNGLSFMIEDDKKLSNEFYVNEHSRDYVEDIFIDIINNKIDINTLQSHLTKKEGTKSIGKINNLKAYVKKGRYGYYVEHDKKKYSVKDREIPKTIEDIEEIIREYTEIESRNIIRSFNSVLTIKDGKYGVYMEYNKTKSKPICLSLKQYKGDIQNDDESDIIEWINKYHKRKLRGEQITM